MMYLSGELSADEREAIAERLASDDAYFAALEELETDWIDRLVRGELSPREERMVRRYLAETGQERRLAFAGALRREAAATSPSETPSKPTVPVHSIDRARARIANRRRWSPAFRAGVIAATLALAALLFWRTGDQPDTPGGPGIQSPAGIGGAANGAGPVAIALLAGVARGSDQIPEFRLPAGAKEVRFAVEIPEGRRFAAYRVALLGQADRVEWESAGALPDPGAAVFEAVAPVSAMGAPSEVYTGELVLYGRSVEGAETLLGYYPFRIRPSE